MNNIDKLCMNFNGRPYFIIQQDDEGNYWLLNGGNIEFDELTMDKINDRLIDIRNNKIDDILE